jgi:hypothetical protein
MSWEKREPTHDDDDNKSLNPSAFDSINSSGRSWGSNRVIILLLLTFGIILRQAFPSWFILPQLSRSLTYEERAIKILSENPLIGVLLGSLRLFSQL